MPCGGCLRCQVVAKVSGTKAKVQEVDAWRFRASGIACPARRCSRVPEVLRRRGGLSRGPREKA